MKRCNRFSRCCKLPPDHCSTTSPSMKMALNGRMSMSATHGCVDLKRLKRGWSSLISAIRIPSGDSHCDNSSFHSSQAAQLLLLRIKTTLPEYRKVSQVSGLSRSMIEIESPLRCSRSPLLNHSIGMLTFTARELITNYTEGLMVEKW